MTWIHFLLFCLGLGLPVVAWWQKGQRISSQKVFLKCVKPVCCFEILTRSSSIRNNASTKSLWGYYAVLRSRLRSTTCVVGKPNQTRRETLFFFRKRIRIHQCHWSFWKALWVLFFYGSLQLEIPFGIRSSQDVFRLKQHEEIGPSQRATIQICKRFFLVASHLLLIPCQGLVIASPFVVGNIYIYLWWLSIGSPAFVLGPGFDQSGADDLKWIEWFPRERAARGLQSLGRRQGNVVSLVGCAQVIEFRSRWGYRHEKNVYNIINNYI